MVDDTAASSNSTASGTSPKPCAGGRERRMGTVIRHLGTSGETLYNTNECQEVGATAATVGGAASSSAAVAAAAVGAPPHGFSLTKLLPDVAKAVAKKPPPA